MSSKSPRYEVFAPRYAPAARAAIANFILPGSHNVSLPMDFYIWAIRGHDLEVLTRFPALPGQPDIVRLDSPPSAARAD
jgi:hypothetical protein